MLLLAHAKDAPTGVETNAVGVMVACGQTVGELSAAIVATGLT
jgi:hypothetical protein